jgi:CubicO group peptidase (beta-lactamase class C family)
MTKPITGMAAMLLIGEGKLRLDQPVADILPKFAKMQVQKTYDGSITDLEPAKSPITIRELITHTSGIGYSIIQRGPIKTAFEDTGLIAGQISRMSVPGLDRGKPVPSLTLFADRLAEMPLVYQPGTHWSYSNGLDLMGRVIEVVSGRPFDTFLKERLFDPIGMTSTFFQVPASAAKRLTTNFGAMGTALIPIDPGDTSIYLDKPPFPFGGAGLVSSPRDYDRFLLMLANYGKVGGKRVIAEAAVRAGTGNLLPPGVAGPAMMSAASNFGAGGRVGVGPEEGLYGWAGAAGTVATVDMKRGIRSGIYVQFMPPNANSLLASISRRSMPMSWRWWRSTREPGQSAGNSIRGQPA